MSSLPTPTTPTTPNEPSMVEMVLERPVLPSHATPEPAERGRATR